MPIDMIMLNIHSMWSRIILLKQCIADGLVFPLFAEYTLDGDDILMKTKGDLLHEHYDTASVYSVISWIGIIL